MPKSKASKAYSPKTSPGFKIEGSFKKKRTCPATPPSEKTDHEKPSWSVLSIAGQPSLKPQGLTSPVFPQKPAPSHQEVIRENKSAAKPCIPNVKIAREISLIARTEVIAVSAAMKPAKKFLF